jgi:hypothetical protein
VLDPLCGPVAAVFGSILLDTVELADGGRQMLMQTRGDATLQFRQPASPVSRQVSLSPLFLKAAQKTEYPCYVAAGLPKRRDAMIAVDHRRAGVVGRDHSL